RTSEGLFCPSSPGGREPEGGSYPAVRHPHPNPLPSREREPVNASWEEKREQLVKPSLNHAAFPASAGPGRPSRGVDSTLPPSAANPPHAPYSSPQSAARK